MNLKIKDIIPKLLLGKSSDRPFLKSIHNNTLLKSI